jgi:hypothetical protein
MVPVRVTSRSRRWGLSLLGLLLGVILSVAVVAPALTREASKQPWVNSGDTGRDMALAAGCDMSQNEVAMEESIYDYIRGAGVATVEEAVLGMRQNLARDGTPLFSTEELEAAVAAADLESDPIEVRLPGATLTIDRTGEGKYLVVETVQCA